MIDKTLEERESRYGDFKSHADVTQAIKKDMEGGRNWNRGLSSLQREALEMIAHKIGRILNGDPDYLDSWNDIVGYARLYARLVEMELQ